MEEPSSEHWFLRKHDDGSLFGPISFEQLTDWASTAQISERYYGPTTLGAIQEFIRLGEIDTETYIINACDGTRRQVQEFPALLEMQNGDGIASGEARHGDVSHHPALSGMSIDLQERIRELEQSLREERRAVGEFEARYRALEQKYNELLSKRRR
jgi:hypothetical protein